MYDGNNALQKIYDSLKTLPDVLIYNYSILKGDVKIELPYLQFNQNSDRLANTVFNSSWSKAIKSSKIKKFLEDCMRGEDTYMWLQVLDECPSIKQIDDSIYEYRIHGNNTVFSEQFKKNNKIFLNALKTLKPKMKNYYVKQSIERRLSLS